MTSSRRSRPRPSKNRYRVQVLSRQTRSRWVRGGVRSFCAQLLAELDQPPGSLAIAFVGNRVMQRLNRRFRGRDYATDVLSFAYPGEVLEGLPYLGEVVIAPDVAALNARESGAPVEGELRALLVHGVLHLLGYDHETDAGEMLRLQARLLRVPALAAAPLLQPAGARRPAAQPLRSTVGR